MAIRRRRRKIMPAKAMIAKTPIPIPTPIPTLAPVEIALLGGLGALTGELVTEGVTTDVVTMAEEVVALGFVLVASPSTTKNP
jgi:uncharacterized protein (DUF697 family)